MPAESIAFEPSVGRGFHHEALFYANAHELLEGTVPFIRQGLAAGEAVMVALPRANVERVQAALGAEADAVRFADMEALGRNPGRIISAWGDFVSDAAASGRGARGIGEPAWPGRSADELDECGRHESLVNVAFAGSRPWSLICPYDTSRLDEQVLCRAERNHPVLAGCRGQTRRCAFEPHRPRAGEPFAGTLSRPESVLGRLLFAGPSLADVRGFVDAHATRCGLDLARTQDLVLAASEVATNSVVHGGGSGSVSMWCDGGAVVCEVRDAGHIDVPLAGRERPLAGRTGGRGMWLANQVCDLVQVRSNGQGSTVRLRMRLGEDRRLPGEPPAEPA
jgi:anti-sigma regulatory factor (Ser/Thr protein kinase)